MNFDIGTIIGSIAATCTTVSFVPQVMQIIRTKNTESISLCMYVIFAIGVSLWLVYGFFLASYPMIISNIITLMLVLIILTMKIREVRKKT